MSNKHPNQFELENINFIVDEQNICKEEQGQQFQQQLQNAITKQPQNQHEKQIQRQNPGQVLEAKMSPIDAFKEFLSTAPLNWAPNELIRRFTLPDGAVVSCVLWNELFHISGTDIVKCLAYRFQSMGRSIVLAKKFEEGIFSDLRNLKPIHDATLEESRSPFLRFLYENQCIRTQKKQKVFYWFSVKHDKLFLDALERDCKRELAGQRPCTVALKALSMQKAMEAAQMHLLTAIPVHSRGRAKGLTNDADHDWVEVDHSEYDRGFAPTVCTRSRSNTPSYSVESSSNEVSFENIISQVQQPYDLNTQLTLPHMQNHYPPALPQYDTYHPGSPPQGIVTPPLTFENVLNAHRARHDKIVSQHYQPTDQFYIPKAEEGVCQQQEEGFNVIRRDTDAYIVETNGSVQHLDQPGKYSESYTDENQVNNANFNYSSTWNLDTLGHSQNQGLRESNHLEEKLYPCQYVNCSRQFRRLEHLKRHLRCHTGERPFPCNFCGKLFSRRDHCIQHSRSHRLPELLEKGDFGKGMDRLMGNLLALENDLD